MACVLVHIEVDGDQPTGPCRAVLGEARRIASSLGASVYAVAVVPPADDAATLHADLVSALGLGGADRVVLVTAGQPEPVLWATVGPALAAACEHVRPNLVLLAATPGGRDIAPRLAARLGGAFIAEPAVETGPRGEVVLSRPVYDGDLWRRVVVEELDVVAVATLDDRRRPALGGDDAEVMQLECAGASAVEITVSDADSGAALESARVVVAAGAGVSAESLDLVADLARALGGELGGTRSLCQRGLIPADREIGVGARHVHPDLYVVCGASGSVAHLGAVSPDAEIVAIDTDPSAPIFRTARWGLVGRIEDVVPELLAALEAGR